MRSLISVALTTSVTLSLSALGETIPQAPNGPASWLTAPQRMQARQSWLKGDLDEGDRLFQEALTARSPRTDADVVMARELSHIARAALEDRQPVKAMLLAERALGRTDTYLAAKSDAPASERAQVFAAKSYVYHRVLHDEDTAAVLLEQALKLDPGNPAYLATLDRLRLHSGSLRVFGTATPRLNAAYSASPQAPRVQAVAVAGAGYRLTLQVPTAGNYRMESTTDLVDWQPFWSGRLEKGEALINDDHAGQAVRFYRSVELPGEAR